MKEKIAEIVGLHHVSDKDEDLFIYRYDSSFLEGKLSLVAWPHSTEEIAKIVKLAHLRNVPIAVRGGGTTSAGCSLGENILLLDLSGMNKILRLHLTERSVTVQPGITVNQLNDFLKTYNLHYPLVPHTVGGVATIGGLVSCNYPSSLLRYGHAGDWVMSCEIVDGTGKSFSPTHPQFFFGAEGVLGIITSLTLKLVPPIPVLSASWKKLSFEELPTQLSVLETDKDILYTEFLDAYCSQLLGLDDSPHLWIEYVFLDKGDVKDPQKLRAIKQQLARLPALLKQHKHTIHTDPFVPRHAHADFLRFCRRHELPVYGHPGVGIFHACVRKEHPETAHHVYKMAQKHGGYPSGENGIGRAWKGYLPVERRVFIQEKKKFYDPSHIMNPGCLL